MTESIRKTPPLSYNDVRWLLYSHSEKRTGALRIIREMIQGSTRDTLQELWRVGDKYEWRDVPIEEITKEEQKPEETQRRYDALKTGQ